MSQEAEEPRMASAKPAWVQKGRYWSFLLFGLLLVSAVFVYLHLTFNRPVGSGPAGPHVDEAQFAHTWSTQSVLLVGLGDSVTAGFGARKGHSYFDRLRENPRDDSADMAGICLPAVFSHLASANLAVSGSTSFELVETQLPRVPKCGTDTMGWIVITTGGNDLIHNYGRTPPREQAMYGATWQQAQAWIERFNGRLDTIVTNLSDRFPGGCHIFLANIYDPTDEVGDIQRAGLPSWPAGARILTAYNEAISSCAERHKNVHLVDLHSGFLGHGIHCAQFWSKHYDSKDPHYWYYTNLEDPNERGYDAIRRLFLIEMAKVAEDLR